VKNPSNRRPPREGAPGRSQGGNAGHSSGRPFKGGPRRRSTGGDRGPARRKGAYRLNEDVSKRIRLGHPFVYKDALGSRTVNEPTGSVVDMIASGHGDFVGRGYVDQGHAVVVRIVTRDPSESVQPGSGAIARRIAQAIQTRWFLFGADKPDALRLFSGDNEGFPGVTVDRFGPFVVVQWLTAGALPWRDEVLEAVRESATPAGIYEQRRFRPLAGQAPPEPAALAWGEEAPLEIVVSEHDSRLGKSAKLAIDVTAPLGVGIFADMRLGRDAVAARARGRRVLNLFSYTGAFSVRCALAGAEEVVAVDTAARVHARARRNYELSQLDPNGMEQVTADAQKSLERFADRGRRFDLVVCDPPTFSHGQSTGESFSVTRDLATVAAGALSVLEPGGLLALSTNSVKTSAADVDRMLSEAGARVGCDVRIVERVGLPPDFPVAPGFPEGNYLKFVLALRL